MISKLLNVFSYKELPKTFVIFYSVGLILYILPFTRDLFLFLTPYSLLLVFVAIIYHHKKRDLNFYIFSVIVITLSYFVEVAGVKTGAIFGDYQYLTSLGPKVLETPLIIGINWLMLTYCSAAIIYYFQAKLSGKIGFVVKVTAGALLMLLYDIIAELVAPAMSMWEFSSSRPPIENFVMWFSLALLFHFLLSLFKIKATVVPAALLFAVQLLFFFLIYIYNLLFI